MSINQKTTEFLRELLGREPNTQAIELEFMQINDLMPFMALLSRFAHLKRLSLHGNRLKELPLDLGDLSQLEQLDLSNNMLTNADFMAMSLKTLPNLRRLLVSIRREDQDRLKKGIPQLQYLNNARVDREKPKSREEPKKVSRYELKPQYIEEAAGVFDEIRELYKESYQQYNDAAMQGQFSQEVEKIMGELKENIEKANGIGSETLADASFLSARYRLNKLSEDKFITYLSDIDQRFGSVAKNLFQTYSYLVPALTSVALSAKPARNPAPLQQSGRSDEIPREKSVDTRNDSYQKEVKRLRRQKQELLAEVAALEIQNKKILDAMIRLSKGERAALPSGHFKSSQRQSSPTRRGNSSIQQPDVRLATSGRSRELSNTTGKTITLKQLKDTIQQIYESKDKFDQKAIESKQPAETMYQHLFTFLNYKYGLKSLTIEWASSIVSGIQQYSSEDNDVAVFGKILRNECEEEFRFVQAEVKATIQQLLKMHLKAKMQYKSQIQIRQALNERINGFITTEEGEDIIRYMYNKADAQELLEKVRVQYSIHKQLPQKEDNRRAGRETQPQTEKKKIKFSLFVKTVLDFQLRSHERYLRPFVTAFKGVDRDSDGIINQEQFSQLLYEMSDNARNILPDLLNMLDPYSTNSMTFSQTCRVLSNHPEGNPVLAGYSNSQHKT